VLDRDTLSGIIEYLDVGSLRELCNCNSALRISLNDVEVFASALRGDFWQQRSQYKRCIEMPIMKKMFADTADVHRRSVCLKALEGILGQADKKTQSEFASVAFLRCAHTNDLEALKMLLKYRTQKTWQTDDLDNCTQRSCLVLPPDSINLVLGYAIQTQDFEMLKSLIDIELELDEEELRLESRHLVTAITRSAKEGFSPGCFMLSQVMYEIFDEFSEDATRQAFIASAEAGNIEICRKMIEFLHSITRGKEEQEPGGDFVNPDIQKAHDLAMVKLALLQAGTHGYTDIILLLLENEYTKPKVEEPLMKLLLRSLCLNGHKDTVEVLFSRNCFSKPMLLEFFDDSARRGYGAAVSSLIDLDICTREFLDMHLEQAELREHDEVAELIRVRLTTI